MSIWVRAIVTESVPLSPALLRAGIAERLASLTYLLCPPQEEEPEDVLARLVIDNLTKPGGDLVYLLRYRADRAHFIRFERWTRPADVTEETAELRRMITSSSDTGTQQVLATLDAARETIAMGLTVNDADSMGWPLAFAAAAYCAEVGKGVLQADGSGWMRPDGSDVAWLID